MKSHKSETISDHRSNTLEWRNKNENNKSEADVNSVPPESVGTCAHKVGVLWRRWVCGRPQPRSQTEQAAMESFISHNGNKNNVLSILFICSTLLEEQSMWKLMTVISTYSHLCACACMLDFTCDLWSVQTKPVKHRTENEWMRGYFLYKHGPKQRNLLKIHSHKGLDSILWRIREIWTSERKTGISE